MTAKDHLEPFGMLDEAPLPERYGTPRIHVAARDPKHLFIYWEAPAGIDGAMTVRFELLRHENGEHRPTGEHHDISVDSGNGRRHVPWSRAGVCLRAQLGRNHGATFEVYAESPVATIPSGESEPLPTSSRASSPWRERP